MAIPVASPTDEALPSPPTARVVRVLELFAHRPVDLIGLTEVARALDLNKATAHAILSTLVELGWLVRDDDARAYALGAGLVALGRSAEQGHPLVSSAAALLADLAARHDVAVSVATVVDDEIRVLDAVAAPSGDHGHVQAGMRVPFAPPFGAVFAAWGRAARTRQWLERAPAGSEAAHAATLQAVIGRGFAIERLTETSRRIREMLRRLAALDDGGEARRALYPLMAELSDAGDGEELPATDAPFPVDVVSVPILDRSGHAALSFAAQIDGLVTRTALHELATDLRAAAARVGAGGPG
jgi:DNA-binding IclR family transcriptional regulator